MEVADTGAAHVHQPRQIQILGVATEVGISRFEPRRRLLQIQAGVDRQIKPRTAGAANRPAGLAREVRVLARQQVWTSLILMLMLMIGQFGLFTYITPTLLEVTGLHENLIPWVLLLNGVGATIGSPSVQPRS